MNQAFIRLGTDGKKRGGWPFDHTDARKRKEDDDRNQSGREAVNQQRHPAPDCHPILTLRRGVHLTIWTPLEMRFGSDGGRATICAGPHAPTPNPFVDLNRLRMAKHSG